MFCQELSNWQCCMSRRIIVMEEPASCRPHFRSLSSYCIPQMSQNRQIKILINCLTFRSEFLMHNASVIKKKQAAYHAHLLCFHGVRRGRTPPVCGLFFGFSITGNPRLVTVNDIWGRFSQTVIHCSFWSSAKSFGTNFAETNAFLNLLLKVCHEPMDVPTSSAISQSVIQWFPR
jgi:hypothetical protein